MPMCMAFGQVSRTVPGKRIIAQVDFSARNLTGFLTNRALHRSGMPPLFFLESRQEPRALRGVILGRPELAGAPGRTQKHQHAPRGNVELLTFLDATCCTTKKRPET